MFCCCCRFICVDVILTLTTVIGSARTNRGARWCRWQRSRTRTTWRWSPRARTWTSCTAPRRPLSTSIRASSFPSASPASISCTGSSTSTSQRSPPKTLPYTIPTLNWEGRKEATNYIQANNEKEAAAAARRINTRLCIHTQHHHHFFCRQQLTRKIKKNKFTTFLRNSNLFEIYKCRVFYTLITLSISFHMHSICREVLWCTTGRTIFLTLIPPLTASLHRFQKHKRYKTMTWWCVYCAYRYRREYFSSLFGDFLLGE